MIAALFLALCAQAPSSGVAAPAQPAPTPWMGTLSDGRAELQRLSRAGDHEPATELGARLRAMPGWSQLDESARAETLFDVGVALGEARAFELATEVMHEVRGLAGSRPLGLDAAYDAGTLRLQSAEKLRLEIPEVRERLGLPALPAPPAQGLPGQPEQPCDALARARDAYLAARGDLVDRLRCDARDRDTRANLELLQRRLRELEQIEREREEPADEQPNQDPKQPEDEQPKDPQDREQQQDRGQDPEPKDDQAQDPEQEPDPKEQPPADSQEQPAGPDPKDVKEVTLSQEEITRLLDQLQKIEQQGEQVRAQLRERQRVPVKKDW